MDNGDLSWKCYHFQLDTSSVLGVPIRQRDGALDKYTPLIGVRSYTDVALSRDANIILHTDSPLNSTAHCNKNVI